MLTGSADDTARLWDASTVPAAHLQWAYRLVTSVAFSSDGSEVLTGSLYDGTARLWDASSGDLLRTFSGHSHCGSVWLSVPTGARS